ncbi:MAG: cytochrome c1 [Aquisalimonadaceae bacterium]
MKKFLLTCLLALMPVMAWPAPSGVQMMSADVDPHDKASLQRGAKLFANYCMACHEAKLIRYNRIGRDLGLDDEMLEKYLMFKPDAQLFDGMTNAMTDEDATDWFGASAPDLSLTARRNGPDWVYTFLNSYYADDTNSTGVNNLVLAGVSMPHVLQELQGLQTAVREEVDGQEVITRLAASENGGVMSAAEYRSATRDITNFLDYVAEPVKAERERLGIRVLIFLFLFLVVAYLLKREYWKDVH